MKEISISQDVFDKIVFAVTEEVLKRHVEIVGNLKMNLAETDKLIKKLYNDNPDFKTDPLSVQAVLNEMEEKNPGIKYEELVKKATPKIRERINTTGKLNVDSVSSRSNLDLNINMDSSGEI